MAFAEIAALHSKEPLSLALTHVARIPAKPAFLSGLMRLALPSHTGRKKFQICLTFPRILLKGHTPGPPIMRNCKPPYSKEPLSR